MNEYSILVTSVEGEEKGGFRRDKSDGGVWREYLPVEGVMS